MSCDAMSCHAMPFRFPYLPLFLSAHVCIYDIHILYIRYICLCECICLCTEREREREREKHIKKERTNERKKERTNERKK